MNAKFRALTVLVIISITLNFAGLFWIAHNVSSQHHQAVVQQAEQRKQGAHVLRLLCGSFGKLAELIPPAGNPETNPSRAYLQDQHAALAEIGPDIGCGRKEKQ